MGRSSLFGDRSGRWEFSGDLFGRAGSGVIAHQDTKGFGRFGVVLFPVVGEPNPKLGIVEESLTALGLS